MGQVKGLTVKVVVVSMVFMYACAAYSAGVLIEDTGELRDSREIDGVEVTSARRSIKIMAGGPVQYNLSYRYRMPAEGAEIPESWTRPPFPWLGDYTANSLGIGLTTGAPHGRAWYEGGFVGVFLDGRRPVRSIADDIVVAGGPDKGVVEFRWKEEWGEMSLKFVHLAGDDKVFTELAFDPREEMGAVMLRLLSVPGHLGSAAVPLDRWAATARRSVQEATALDVGDENWLLSFDANSNTRGSAAVLFLPEQVETADVNPASTTRTRLTLKDGVSRARMIFWSLPDSYMTPEQAYGYLAGKAGEYTEALRGFEF